MVANVNVNFEAMERDIDDILLDLIYKDITMDEAKQELLDLHIVSKRYHFEWEDENKETKHFYISVTKEEDAFNEFYSHFPNAKHVMVSKS